MTVSKRQIDVLVHVAQLGSVTESARALGMSQPAVSKALALLEQQMGFTLFERVGGRMKLTPEASLLYEEALRMQQGVARFERAVENVRRFGAGQLRICATPALALNVLPFLAARLRAKFPDHGLVMDMCLNHEVEAGVERREYDVGFFIGASDPAHPDVDLVTEGQMVCVMQKSHPLSRRHAVQWEDLNPREVIYVTTDTKLVAMMESAFPGFRDRPVSTLETNRYSLAVNLVRQGHGVTLVDQFALSGTDRANLVTVPLLPSLPIAVYAANSAQASSRALAAECIEGMRAMLNSFGNE